MIKVGDKVTLEDSVYDSKVDRYHTVIRRGKVTKVEEYSNDWMGGGYCIWADYGERGEIGVDEDDLRLSKGLIGLLKYAVYRLMK